MAPPTSYQLSEEPLEDLLLALEAREESAELHIDTKSSSAQVWVSRGRLSRASFGSQDGKDALRRLLSHREGSYSIIPCAPSEGDQEFPELGQIIREKEIKSTRIGASSQRQPMRVRTTLTRTSAPLPSGLSPTELRSLASINGRTTVLNLVKESKDSAAESLHAFRRLLQLGLVSEVATSSFSPTRTLSMGTGRLPERTNRSAEKVSNSIPLVRRIALTGTPREDHTDSLSPEEKQLNKKATGHWAKTPERRVRLDSTGYSSVPPPSLGTEQVSLPRSLRDKRDQSAPPPRTYHEVAPPDLPTSPSASHLPHPRHDTPTALSLASVRPDGGFPKQSYELRESEIPIPSTKLDRATLEQLDELNAAVQSSRRPNLPVIDDASVPSSKEKPSSEPGPPSSLGLGLSLGDLPSPGSVPHPGELPWTSANEAHSGLPQVGRYEVLARLKRGGMGSVYMCRLSGTAGFRRLFAMKVLHGHLAEQSQSLEAFFHEARVLGELHHPNIVGIADVGTPHEPYIVMDYIEGGSLSELFRATSSGRDPALVVSVVLGALNGLAYAHSAQDDNGDPLELVHFDVTPHNLLVGIDGTCRVTDFGIARTKKEVGDPTVVQGKPGYLAPERIKHDPADHRADVFSMGVVLYFGLTGVEPFRGASADETAQLILEGRVNPPSEVGFRPPPALDWICMTALAKDPSARYPSAQEMGLHLRRIAEREGLLAPDSDVASWVKASLGPTLAARRAASMRGTGTTEPPPPVAPAPHQLHIDPSRFPTDLGRPPSEPPSAAETTGPLEPPSSQAFDENTEIISGRSVSASDNNHPNDAAARRRQLLAYAALFVALVAVVWAFAAPEQLAKLFSVEQPSQAGSVQGAPSATPVGAPAPKETPSDRPRSQGKKIEIDEDGHVVLPPIQPSRSK